MNLPTDRVTKLHVASPLVGGTAGRGGILCRGQAPTLDYLTALDLFHSKRDNRRFPIRPGWVRRPEDQTHAQLDVVLPSQVRGRVDRHALTVHDSQQLPLHPEIGHHESAWEMLDEGVYVVSSSRVDPLNLKVASR